MLGTLAHSFPSGIFRRGALLAVSYPLPRFYLVAVVSITIAGPPSSIIKVALMNRVVIIVSPYLVTMLTLLPFGHLTKRGPGRVAYPCPNSCVLQFSGTDSSLQWRLYLQNQYSLDKIG